MQLTGHVPRIIRQHCAPPSVSILKNSAALSHDFCQNCFLLHLFFVIRLCVFRVADRTEHPVLGDLLHAICSSLIQRPPLYRFVDAVEPAFVNLLQRMIRCQLPLLSSFQVSDLPAGASHGIIRSKTTAVFCVVCVVCQKPFAADTALLRRMTLAQTFKEI